MLFGNRSIVDSIFWDISNRSTEQLSSWITAARAAGKIYCDENSKRNLAVLSV